MFAGRRCTLAALMAGPVMASEQGEGGFRWDDARVLLALLRERSLSRAGTCLGVNASTVGRRLDALEASLGLRLFDRRTDGVAPTEAAHVLAPHAESLEAAAHGVVRAARGLEVAPEGWVRLAAPPAIAAHLLAPRLRVLQKRHPRLRVELLASTDYVDLDRREADLAVRARRPGRGDLIVRRLGTRPSVVMAASGVVERLGCLRDVRDVSWLTWSTDLAQIPSGRWVATHVPDEQVVLRSNAMESLIEGARAGLGAMVLNRVFSHLPGLQVLPLGLDLDEAEASLPIEAVYLVGHEALRTVPRVDAVWRFIVDMFETLPGDPPHRP